METDLGSMVQVTRLMSLLFWAKLKWCGKALGFANQLNVHVSGLCVNGVFDRFPNLRIIIGHMGEHLPYDLERTSNRLEMLGRTRGMPMKKNLYSYWGKNIFITTSGHFSTPALVCAMTR